MRKMFLQTKTRSAAIGRDTTISFLCYRAFLPQLFRLTSNNGHCERLPFPILSLPRPDGRVLETSNSLHAEAVASHPHVVSRVQIFDYDRYKYKIQVWLLHLIRTHTTPFRSPNLQQNFV